MTYSLDYRRKVLSVREKEGLTIAEVADLNHFMWRRLYLTGELPARDFASNAEAYLSCAWVPPKMEYTDPVKKSPPTSRPSRLA